MDTKPRHQRDHSEDLQSIDTKAASPVWEDRLSAIGLMQTLLRDKPAERTVELLVAVLGRMAADMKWEVRKAILPVLVDTGHPSSRGIIDRLAGDGNQWVRQAAERAKRKLARITTPADKRDRRSEFAFELIKNLKAASPEKIYETALLIGEKYYEELAGDTAHEMNTYQTAMNLLLNELERHVAEGRDVKDILAKIRERSRYLKALGEGLLEYARDKELVFQLCPVKPMVVDALNMARDKTRALLGDQAVRENVDVSDQIAIQVSRVRMVQALANIISNAFESLENKGDGAVLEIVAASTETGGISLTVRDSGCGMDSTQVENAKKRFRSLKKERGGIGLGLPLAIKVVQREHGGRLDIESELGVGTTVTVDLPLRRETKE